MKGKLYLRLAMQNMRRNYRTYVPYTISCLGTAMMFYIMAVLSMTPTLAPVYGGRTTQMTLGFGMVVIALFAIIFMFYTNSFLMKRRKKEFGLFNILGMEKRHIMRVMAVETAFTAAVSIAAGILLGRLLSKLTYMLLMRLLNMPQPQPLAIPVAAVPVTAILFSAFFALTLIKTMFEVRAANPAALLRESRQGEKEPRANPLLAIFGIAALGGGYYLSLTVQSALRSIPVFFLAVILVILGTFALFTAGSVTLLRALRKNEAIYYHPTRFHVISGMIYRMKQNAAGLAVICILSTMVLVMVSSTASLFMGREDVINKQMKRDKAVALKNVSVAQAQDVQALIAQEVAKAGGAIQNPLAYRRLDLFSVQRSPGAFEFVAPNRADYSKLTGFYLVPVSDYAVLNGQDMPLDMGEAYAYSNAARSLPSTISLGGQPVRIRQMLSRVDNISDQSEMLVEIYVLLLKDEDIARIAAAVGDERQAVFDARGQLLYDYKFEFDAPAVQDHAALQKSIAQVLGDHIQGGFSVQDRASVRNDLNGLYVGLLYVAVFLGTLFMMAMALIIYYKQISEGYDDQVRFQIMQKVGMSLAEVRRSIRTQVLMVFFLPLVVAGIHLAAAFHIVTMILRLLALSNTALFAYTSLVVFLLFSLFYAFVFARTAKSYYNIVKTA